MRRVDALSRFYGLLNIQSAKIGGPVALSRLDFTRLPQRGVYFFFEAGEVRSNSSNAPRVVRVGTHALTLGAKSTLGGWLRQHRGSSHGGGNHRGSIFRLIVGRALIACGEAPACPSWGVKGDARSAALALGMDLNELCHQERPLEQAVSKVIGAMPVLWLDVPDLPSPGSLRGTIEQGAIALLSNALCSDNPSDLPSLGWLGRHSDRPKVRASGLWNQNHVDETYNESFLDQLEKLVVTNSA
jgi:hypothetical protein